MHACFCHHQLKENEIDFSSHSDSFHGDLLQPYSCHLHHPILPTIRPPDCDFFNETIKLYSPDPGLMMTIEDFS